MSVESSVEPSVSIALEQPLARDPNDKEGILNDQISTAPLDILNYVELVKILEAQDKFNEVNEVYDQLHSRFSLLSSLWVLQLKGNLQRDEFDTVEKLLAQCLSGDMANNDLSLWLTYLDYVRRKNNLITGGQEARSIVIQAFELVLERCARFEPHSTPFWNDYINFLENWNPMNKWEEQQKIDMLRSLYKKLLIVPFDNLEKMWNKYTKWEQEINNLTARKFIGELSADYMKARSLYQEWSNLTKGLRRVTPMNLNTCNKNNIPQYNYKNDKHHNTSQLGLWIKWIEWEKENKLILTEEKLNERIVYVYQQAIQFMLFEPEMWYEYAMFLPADQLNERKRILSIALRSNPSSPSLTFKLSECFELENNIDEVKKCFESTITFSAKQNKLLKLNYEQSNGNLTDLSQLNKSREELTFIYCIYMNTMKRLSGLSAARAVFSKCRKQKNNLTYHIYIENAYLEFQNQNDYKTACKVLELGLKYFQNDGEYINKYLEFLILINKDSQIKTLFETSIEKVDDPLQLRSIYKKMISYESKFGNLNNVYSLEKRFFERFPKESLIETFTDRYQIQHENYIKKLELSYMYKKDQYKLLSNLSLSDSKRKRLLDQDERYETDSNPNKRQHKDQVSIPNEIIELLKVLPKRQYFKNAVLDPTNLIDFLVDQVEVPTEK